MILALNKLGHFTSLTMCTGHHSNAMCEVKGTVLYPEDADG